MAAAEVISGSPLAEALQNAVQPKLAENGWSSGAVDDSALSEYIILMLANGKTQEQIASELANDLLGLDPSDPGPVDFAQWLFEQVAALNAQLNGGSVQQTQSTELSAQASDFTPANGSTSADNESSMQDATMSGALDTAGAGAVPTGPKSMRNGSGGQRGRDRRMVGQMRQAMDRTGDGGIHRIKGAASRVNSHSRDPPAGPRNTATRMQNMMTGGGRGGQPMNPQMMANMASSVDPQQQMALFKMLEEQSRMMAQILGPQGQAAVNPNFHRNQRGRGGKSLFERVDRRNQNGTHSKPHQATAAAAQAAGNGEDMDMADDGSKKPLGEVACKFQLSCTSPTCPYAHQSAAAPPGVSIDVNDTCSYGAACTNKKCVASHPSPAQKRQYLSSSVDCKFYPNCTNPSCPFRHPSAPPCRNGADCPQKDSGCKFSHSAVLCRYTPCLNPHCVFRHEPGQKQGNKWTKDGANGGDHVSERKFVNEDGGQGEELIIPGSSMAEQGNEMETEGGNGVVEAEGGVIEGGMDQAADVVS